MPTRAMPCARSSGGVTSAMIACTAAMFPPVIPASILDAKRPVIVWAKAKRR